MIFPQPDLLLPPLQEIGVSPDIASFERAHYQAMAVQDVAALGLPMGVVSNSDGTVQAELRRLGVCYAPDGQQSDAQRSDAPEGVPVGVVIDSAVVGVAKPDPAIFNLALDTLGVPANGTVLHVGDSLRYDIAGAVAAGLQPVHLDPHGFCPAPDGHRHIRTLTELAGDLSGLSGSALTLAGDRLRACPITA